jgi:SOS response regulatory protein OraA/RecX
LNEAYAGRDQTAIARELAQRHCARLRSLDPLVARRRLADLLRRRGFNYEEVKPVIDEVLGAPRDDESA